MKRYKDWSLRAKFNILCIMLVMLTAVCLSVYEIKRISDTAIESWLSDGAELAGTLAAFGRYATETEEAAAIESIIAGASHEALTYLGLLRSDMSVLAEKWHEPAGDPFPDWYSADSDPVASPVFSSDGRYVQFVAAIGSDPSAAGS